MPRRRHPTTDPVALGSAGCANQTLGHMHSSAAHQSSSFSLLRRGSRTWAPHLFRMDHRAFHGWISLPGSQPMKRSLQPKVFSEEIQSWQQTSLQLPNLHFLCRLS